MKGVMMITKNIIKNQYTHRVIESKQADTIEIGAKEIILPQKELLDNPSLKSNLNVVNHISENRKHSYLSSLISLNSFLIVSSLILSLLVIYSFSEQIIAGNLIGKNPISNEALFSIGIYFLLLCIALPVFLLKKKFILKIRNNYLDINYSMNNIHRISLDEVRKCRVLSKDEDELTLWTDLDLSKRKKSYRTNFDSAVAVFLKDGRCLLFGTEK